MVKMRIGDAWMPADKFGRSLPSGLGLNMPALRPMGVFGTDVLGGETGYPEPDLCVANLAGLILLLHADKPCHDHPIRTSLTVRRSGAGAEI